MIKDKDRVILYSLYSYIEKFNLFPYIFALFVLIGPINCQLTHFGVKVTNNNRSHLLFLIVFLALLD